MKITLNILILILFLFAPLAAQNEYSFFSKKELLQLKETVSSFTFNEENNKLARERTQEETFMNTYRVGPEDNLQSILKKTGTTKHLLLAANGYEYIKNLKTGDTIRFFGSYYWVQPGDYLTLIAQRLGVSTEQLMLLNSELIKNSGHIEPAWKLRIRSEEIMLTASKN